MRVSGSLQGQHIDKIYISRNVKLKRPQMSKRKQSNTLLFLAIAVIAIIILFSKPPLTGKTIGTGAGPPAECADSIDNDGDTLIDYPADPGCLDPGDNSESLDTDADGVEDGIDNCNLTPNSPSGNNQTDSNSDGVGDACTPSSVKEIVQFQN